MYYMYTIWFQSCFYTHSYTILCVIFQHHAFLQVVFLCRLSCLLVYASYVCSYDLRYAPIRSYMLIHVPILFIHDPMDRTRCIIHVIKCSYTFPMFVNSTIATWVQDLPGNFIGVCRLSLCLCRCSCGYHEISTCWYRSFVLGQVKARRGNRALRFAIQSQRSFESHRPVRSWPVRAATARGVNRTSQPVVARVAGDDLRYGQVVSTCIS